MIAYNTLQQLSQHQSSVMLTYKNTSLNIHVRPSIMSMAVLYCTHGTVPSVHSVVVVCTVVVKPSLNPGL
jgi:hypothetical protein